MKDRIKNILKVLLGFKYYIIVGIALIIILIFIAGMIFIIKQDDTKNKKDDEKNAPHAVEEYTDGVNIEEDGKLNTSLSANELWEKMKETDNRALEYLDGPDELKKLMNAEMVTAFPDTRADPNADIDWDSFFKDVDSKEVQGIVKFKRSDSNGNVSTLTYMEPEQFQALVDSNNSEVLKHFTLEKYAENSYSGNTDESYDDNINYAGKAGEIIELAKSRVGGRYSWGGNTWGTSKNDCAMDCSGFVTQVMYHAGLINSSAHIYSGDWRSKGRPVASLEQAQAGDIICYNGHVAIYDGQGMIYEAKGTAYGITHDRKAAHAPIITIRRMIPDGVTAVDNSSSSSGSSGDSDSKTASGSSETSSTTTSNETNNGTGISSFKDYLVIGDSIAGRLGPKFRAEGATVVYKDGVRADYYVKDFDSLIGNLSISPKGIYLILGQNAIVSNDSYRERYGFEYLKELVTKLQSKFPNVPIYINSVLTTTTKGYNNISADVFLKNQKALNAEIKSYCDSTNGVNYVDVLNGYVDSNGYTKDGMTTDGLHPSNAGQDILINNMKSNSSGENSSNSDDNPSQSDLNGGSKISYVVKIATWQETDTSSPDGNDKDYSLSTTTVNYQEMLQQFSMPFEYLWTYMVMGEDFDIVSDIADLVYNSKIEITVFDNLNVDTQREEYTYEKRIDQTTQEIDSEGKTVSKTTTTWEPHSEVTTIVTRTNTIDAEVTLADVWFEKYTREYIRQTETTTMPESNEKLPDTSDLRNRNIKRNETIENTTYVGSPASVKEKTDPKAKEPNFVSVFLQQSNSGAKKTIIDSGAEWIFESLEQNANTKKLVDLTKYLFYKINGENYGVTEFDFGTFDPGSFSSGTVNIVGGTVEEKVWWALINAGYSKEATAGVLGNIAREAGYSFNTNTKEKGGGGYGLCQWTNGKNGKGRRLQLEKYAASKGVPASDIDTQIEFLLGELHPGGGCNGFATYQFMTHQYGVLGCTRSEHSTPLTYDDWKNATTPEEAARIFCWTWERPRENADGIRSERERMQAARAYYEKYKNATMPGSNSNDDSTSSDSTTAEV